MHLSNTTSSRTALVAALTLLSWLGAYIHTTLELQLPVWSPENSVPALVGLALFLGWWRQPRRRRLWSILLLAWTAGAHLLIGAVLSVLPLPLWPFYPEQSVAHYLSHAIYAATQLPLIGVLWRDISR
ncbi:MAG TPA: hypothetical protein VK879_15240 [Candidatus Sulfomarinibacteraceae bacterium]|nr:hypothetical protein [Candidatus Sulfomarinibacteraceae bacterium]